MGMTVASDVQGTSNEVYTIAVPVRLDPAQGEKIRAYELAMEGDPQQFEWLGDVRGKYLKLGDWYIHIREDSWLRAGAHPLAASGADRNCEARAERAITPDELVTPS
jgi:hypothetical protein